MEQSVAFVHGMSVRVQGRNGAVFEEIAYVEELVECETVLLALCRVGCHVVEFAEASCECNMPSIIQAGLTKDADTVLSVSA